jgi:uridine phosphorylase
VAVGFPRFAGKHSGEQLVSPEVILEWRRTRGLLPDRCPDSVIMLYQRALFRAIVEREATTPLGGRTGWYENVELLDRTDGQVGVVGDFGVGAPGATIVLEDLIALGVRRFVSMGTAGALQQTLEPGHVVLCTGAVRDDGVSHHYAPADADAVPDAALTEAFEGHIARAGLPFTRGRSWIIDAPYCETAAEVRHYRQDGVQCVEMEAAALFTVAAHRGAALAAAFCISDLIADAEWNPSFDHPELAQNLPALYRAAVETLAD